MHASTFLRAALLTGLLVFILAACMPPDNGGPCTFTANAAVTAYRLPDSGSEIFATLGSGESFAVLARTGDGWLGFDPGFAQAGNIGLAHHRWVPLNLTVGPSCLENVDLVTLADVQADLDASSGN